VTMIPITKAATQENSRMSSRTLVMDHLLQLDAIALNQRQALRELGLQRNPITRQLAACQGDDVDDGAVDVELICPRQRPRSNWKGLGRRLLTMTR
jgi:hypothetical protein